MIYTGKKRPEYYKDILMKADKDLHLHIFEAFEALGLPKDAKILDFGCGEGALSQRLSDAGYQVDSVDIDEVSFKASTHFIRLDFNSADLVSAFIQEHQEGYDCVLGIEVIEHIENHWEYIKNLKKLVRPGGYILLSTPNVTSWLSRFYFLFTGRLHQFMEQDLSYGHINPISFWQIEYIFKNLDITLVSNRSAGTLPMFYFPVFSLKSILINLFSLLFTPWMGEAGGPKMGWCIITIGQKRD